MYIEDYCIVELTHNTPSQSTSSEPVIRKVLHVIAVDESEHHEEAFDDGQTGCEELHGVITCVLCQHLLHVTLKSGVIGVLGVIVAVDCRGDRGDRGYRIKLICINKVQYL